MRTKIKLLLMLFVMSVLFTTPVYAKANETVSKYSITYKLPGKVDGVKVKKLPKQKGIVGDEQIFDGEELGYFGAYHFVGWATEQGASEATILPGSPVKDVISDSLDSKQIKLYPVFDEKYSYKRNWAYWNDVAYDSSNDNAAIYEQKVEKPVDVFYICSTVESRDDRYHADIDDEEYRTTVLKSLIKEAGMYRESGCFYSPYYEQISLPCFWEKAKVRDKWLTNAYRDIEDAFEYYYDHRNSDRPVIIAGFSQGADMAIKLSGKLMADEKYKDNIVATYAIGWRLTDKDLKKYKQLKPAQGEADTGVVITYSCEAEGITDSMILPKKQKTYSINPLNWKTDGTMADASLNLGCCFTGSRGIKEEIPGYTGAYIDEKRGTLIVEPDDEIKKKVTKLMVHGEEKIIFPEGVYHLYDYQFFYRNLEKNVATRIAAFMNANN